MYVVHRGHHSTAVKVRRLLYVYRSQCCPPITRVLNINKLRPSGSMESTFTHLLATSSHLLETGSHAVAQADLKLMESDGSSYDS